MIRRCGAVRAPPRPPRPRARGRGPWPFPRAPGLLLALLAAVASTVSGGTLLAQEHEEARRHGIFVDSVEVSLISIEVFATRDGEPLADLSAADFEVLVDGVPVELASATWSGPSPGADPEAAGTEEDSADFAADGSSEPGSGAPAPADTTLEPMRAGAPRRSERASVIVLVDQLFLAPSSRAQVLQALSAELDALIDGGARILVAAKSREEVAILQDFTEDARQVLAALGRAAEAAPASYASEIQTTIELWDVTLTAGESRQAAVDGNEFAPQPATRTSELDARAAMRDARGLSERIHADVTGGLRALHRFLDSLAGLPGRKTLVYVADRLPLRPAEQLWRAWWEDFGIEHGARLGVTPTGPADLDASDQLEELIADAAASRVAFYPVGAGGAGVGLGGAASRGATTQSGLPVRATSSSARARAADGLRWLSERTGGRSLVGSPAVDAFFASLASDLGSYYSLAFASPHQGDGRSHRLEVRVRRPGVTVRHPTEYRDKSADQRLADLTLSALTLGFEENPLEVRVTVGKAKRAERGGGVTVPLEIQVPMANLVLIPDTRVHRGKLSIQLVARDDRGRVSDPVLVRLPLEVAHGDLAWALGQTVDHALETRLEAGGGEIAVGVHDDYGFTSSTLVVEVGAGGDG